MIRKVTTQRGYIIILHTVLFLAITIAVVIGVLNPILSSYKAVQAFMRSGQAFVAADSGMEEAVYRVKNGLPIPASFTLNLSTASTTITIVDTATGKKIVDEASTTEFARQIEVNLVKGTGASFHYGIHAGRGGFSMKNSSSITGNVFSGGPVTGAGNIIRGDAVSTDAAGLIYGVHTTGSAYAHTIGSNSAGTLIDANAYYTNENGTVTVSGISYPGSSDQAYVPPPISDAQIHSWESIAANKVTATCENGKYVIDEDKAIGPMKIPCDLEITGSSIATITGHIWVTGNIDMKNSSVIAMSPDLGSSNVAIIADNPNASTTSGIITIGQSSSFQSSGSVGSYVFMISQNGSTENGGSTNAINVGQSASALIAYAIHGQMSLGQSVSLKEVTAYKIALTNSANITYDSGLSSVLFSSGPSGGYNLATWIEF